ncbi:RND family transporter [candidate division WOR-3 bacterium]|nr:RND family transporter [candidate division WOR-3 bacterium]
MMKRIAYLVFKFPGWIVLVVSLLTLGAVFLLSRLKVEADVISLLPENESGVRVLKVVDTDFGGSDQVVVLVEADNLFTAGGLLRLDSLVRSLEALSPVNEVVALTNLQDVVGVGEEVKIARVIESIPTSETGLKKLRERLLGDERYRGRLLAEDGNSMLLLVRLKPGVDKLLAVEEIEKEVQKKWAGTRVSLTGSAALMKFMRDWMMQDLTRLIPLVVLVLVLVFVFLFRNWQGVILPLLTVGIAVLWTLGLIALTGQPLTVVLIVLPPIVLSVGSAYGIHIVERWLQERRMGKRGLELVQTVVGNTGMPVFLAMATTVVGFGANVVMRINAIRAFAIFSVIGVIFSFILAVVFLPALLVLLERRRRCDTGKPQGMPQGRNSIFERWANWIERARIPVFICASIIMIVSLFWGVKVKPETDFVRYFKPGSSPTRAAKIVNEQFGGELQFEIVVDGDIQDPAVLYQIDKFINELKKVRYVTHITSIVDVLKRANRAFHGDDPKFEVIPDTREGIAQFLLLLSFSGSDYLAAMVTSDYARARITAQFSQEKSSEIAKAVIEIRKLIKRNFGSDVKVELGGMPLAVYALHRAIATSQLWSIVVAFLAVFIIVAAFFRSVRFGLAGMVPIGFTLLVAFGVMGILGIEVDIVTAMLGAIALGIGIDYSCHFLSRFQEESRNGVDIRECLRRTLAGVGPPIVINALAVGLGFAVLAFASLVIIQKFGLLIAGAMLLSCNGALVLLPAIFAGFRDKKAR